MTPWELSLSVCFLLSCTLATHPFGPVGLVIGFFVLKDLLEREFGE